MIKQYIKSFLGEKKIFILGYGREGQSTLKLLHELLPDADLTVGDSNEVILDNDPLIKNAAIKTSSGPEYLDQLNTYDVIIKSPGVHLDSRAIKFDPAKITSQTDIFLSVYRDQIAGITGTKGKSTTSSLLYHIIKLQTPNVVFGGNIGTSLFSLIDQIDSRTKIVCEFSSHQLEYIKVAPRYSVLLNLFQEHLDHYNSFYHYQRAKFNIALKQKPGDIFFYSSNDSNITGLLEEIEVPGEAIPLYNGEFTGTGLGVEGTNIVLKSKHINRALLPLNFNTRLIGTHNRQNSIVASAIACFMGIPTRVIREGLRTFNSLEHRLELVGVVKGVTYYNDSISTIPEATIAAIESLKTVNTLILGGFDRGINYTHLTYYLVNSPIENLVFTGPAGLKIYQLIQELETSINLYYKHQFDHAVEMAITVSKPGGLCLLSPAASSFNEFKDFTYRGQRFKELVMKP